MHRITKQNEEEMLQKLRAEIIKLGLENTPSKIKITKLYDRNLIPSPSTYVYHFGTWDYVLKRIGLENNRINSKKLPDYKLPRIKWEEKYEGAWLEALIEELCRVGLNENPSATELTKVYDKTKIPSPSMYIRKLGSWKNVLKKIEKDKRIKLKTKRNKLIRENSGTVGYNTCFPKGPNKELLIDAILSEMKNKKLYSREDYQANYNTKELPDMSIFTKATGLQWKDLCVIYEEHYGVKLKHEREKHAADINISD